MKVVLFGATGMVGQGVLRECLLDPEVERVVAVGRAPTGQRHEKLRELIQSDLFDLTPLEADLGGLDACFFCLGVSSFRMAEADYHRITYDLTLAAARTLLKLNPTLTFIYVSGANTDSTAAGKTMWARVKGQTENTLLAMPFKKAFMFRPAYIHPMHGVASRTPIYRLLYKILGPPLYPLLKAFFPEVVSTTEQVGLAMLEVAKRGAPMAVLESADIVEAAKLSRRHSSTGIPVSR